MFFVQEINNYKESLNDFNKIRELDPKNDVVKMKSLFLENKIILIK